MKSFKDADAMVCSPSLILVGDRAVKATRSGDGDRFRFFIAEPYNEQATPQFLIIAYGSSSQVDQKVLYEVDSSIYIVDPQLNLQGYLSLMLAAAGHIANEKKSFSYPKHLHTEILLKIEQEEPRFAAFSQCAAKQWGKFSSGSSAVQQAKGIGYPVCEYRTAPVCVAGEFDLLNETTIDF